VKRNNLASSLYICNFSYSLRVGNEEVVANAVGFVDTSKYVVVGPTEDVNKINSRLGCTNRRIGNSNICQVI
jgi:hypothetical protein